MYCQYCELERPSKERFCKTCGASLIERPEKVLSAEFAKQRFPQDDLVRLAEHFQRELGLPAETIDPLRRIRLGARIGNFEHLQMTRHLWGVGIGLALHGLPTA